MTIVEKLKEEEKNYLSIKLYGDGSLFAKAFERSAYSFILSLKKCKPIIQYNAELKMKYISIGIPANSIAHVISKKYDFQTGEPEPGTKIYHVPLPLPLFSEEEFQKWKKDLLIQDFETKTRGEKSVNEDKKTIIHSETFAPDDPNKRLAFLERATDEILSVQIQDISPMKALNILSTIQNKLRNAKQDPTLP